MNGHCTCGAALAERALFCHKCGKPQFEEAAPEVAVLPAPPVATAASAPAIAGPEPISFSNRPAVRTALSVAAGLSLLFFIPMPAVFETLWHLLLLLAGGFVAVYVYHRRTGDHLSVRSGAKLGWLSGLFCFLIMAVLFTFSAAILSTGPGLTAMLLQAARNDQTPEVAQMLEKILQEPAGLGFLVFAVLALFFVMLTLLMALGGALSAKVLERE